MLRFVEGINRGVAALIGRVIDLLYIAPLRRWISRETLRYFVCGVGNYIILDATLYYTIYHYIVDVSYIYIGTIVISPHIASLLIVFPITFMSGFWLNRYVAFGATMPAIRGQIMRYGISVGGSIALSYVALKILVEVCGVWATPAKVMSSLLTATYSYLMARFYTFKK